LIALRAVLPRPPHPDDTGGDSTPAGALAAADEIERNLELGVFADDEPLSVAMLDEAELVGEKLAEIIGLPPNNTGTPPIPMRKPDISAAERSLLDALLLLRNVEVHGSYWAEARAATEDVEAQRGAL
jgi:hypothetical protein